MGSCFEALVKGILIAPLDSRYTQVGLIQISIQVLAWIDGGALYLWAALRIDKASTVDPSDWLLCSEGCRKTPVLSRGN